MSLLLSGKTVILMNPDLGDQDFLHLLEYTDTECVMLPDELKKELVFLEKNFRIESFFNGKAADGNSHTDNADNIAFPDCKSEFLCFTSGTSKAQKL